MSARDSESITNIYLGVIVFFAASLVLADYGNRFFVYVVQIDVHHRFIAGIIEPVLTKFLPASVVVSLLEWYEVPDDYLRAHPYRMALLGGFSVALFERILFVVIRGGTISLGFTLAAALHVLNALLIAGLVFSTPTEEQDWMFLAKLVAITVLAMIIHVWWNGWGVLWVAETF
ncbi:hypothetical protein [Halapricum salinum]|nr:hypothetical protein [Halapricum salinum]